MEDLVLRVRPPKAAELIAFCVRLLVLDALFFGLFRFNNLLCGHSSCGAIQRIEMDNREKNHDPGRGVPKGS